MGLVLDTCILIHAERHEALDFSPWASHGDAFISAITVSELLVGVHRATATPAAPAAQPSSRRFWHSCRCWTSQRKRRASMRVSLPP